MLGLELVLGLGLWTLTHGHTSAGNKQKIYILLLCEDIWCRLEDVLRMVGVRDGWWKKFVLSACLNDDDEDDIYLND